MRNRSRLGDGVIQQIDAVLQCIIARQLGLQHRDCHFHRGQVLADGIVQFAGEFSSFLILQR